MAENVNANIRVDLDTSAALASLQTLQSQISNFNRSVVQGNAQAVAAQKSMTATLAAQIAATKGFSTSMVNVETSVSRLGRAIDKNKLSLGEYFRYGAASSKTFGSVFRKEHNEIMGLAADRVKRLQTQYIALGEAQNGVTRAMAVRPMNLFNADAAIGIQRQQLFNKLLNDGSTSLINFGKNTQWAGRQLMVGFTVPLTIFGGIAGQIFMDLERQVVNFRRVYGDAMTPAGETDQMVEEIQNLGREFTKYGIAVKDTVGLAGQVAAAGAQGEDLVAATAQSTRLATLGMIEMEQAMTATMALQTAFQLNNIELAQSIDFLNAVENQTVLSLSDVSEAIPRVAPIIKGLGGDVQDLAIFLTAMREGGVSAAEGANALKSGLASLINPTKNAREQLNKVGINISQILSQNKGDIRAIVTEFGAALGELDKFERQQTLAKVFGKYQFARLGALFENISRSGSQAQRVVDLTAQSFEELGALAEKELSAIEESVGMKFIGAVERLKLAVAPIGEVFLRVATPIIDVVTKLLDKFNELSPGVKQFITVLVAGIGVVVPTVIMLIGLIGNFIGQAVKGFALFNNFFNRLRGGGKDLEYLSNEELDAAAAAASLEGKTTSLTSALNTQRSSVIQLARAYSRYTEAANVAAVSLPQGVRTVPARTMATGGMVGGTGNKDTEPALLTPGEFVMNREATQKFGPILDAMNRGAVSGYAEGSRMFTFGDRTFEAQSGRSSSAIQKLLQRLGDISEDQKTQLIYALEKLQATNDITKTSLQSSLKEVGIEIRNLPSGMVDAHVFEQKQVNISGAEARRLAAASGSPITAEESLRKLDVLDELEAAVPGSTRIMQRSDFVVGLPKEINQALKSGLSAGAFADAFESSGIQKWGKIIKMSGASAEDAVPEFMLLERKIIELSRNAELAGLKVGDVSDKSRGIISFGDITRQAVDELKTAGHSMGIVDKAISDLNGRFRTFQVGINSELIPALKDAGYTVKEISRVSRSGRSERGYEISGRGITPTFFRGQSQRERARGAYGNVTPTDLSKYYNQGESVGEITGEGAISGLEISTKSKSDSRESQRVANDVANGFENQLKARVGDVRKAGEILGSAGVGGVASGSSDIRQILKEQLGVGPLVEQEQANLRETIKLRQAENRELLKRAQIIARQKGVSADIAKRMAAEQIAQERAATIAPVPSVQPVTKGPVVPEGAKMLPIVSAQLAEETQKTTREVSKMRSAATKMGGALKNGSMKMQGALFGLDGLIFGLSFMENSIGQFAQKIMPAVFGFQALTMILPMLMTPAGLLIAAIGGAVAGLYLMKKNSDNIAEEGAKLAQALTASTKEVSGFGDFYGRQSRAQRQEAKTFGTTTEELSKAEEFLKTDFGKTMAEGMSLAIDSYGVDSSAKQFANKLGSMILQGVITTEEANNIAAALSKELGLTGFDLKVNGELKQLIGPDGTNILKNGVDIAVRLQEEGAKTTEGLQDVVANSLEVAQAAINADENIRRLIAAANASPEELKIGPIPMGWIQGIAEDASMASEEVAAAKKQVVAFGTTISGVVSSQYSNLASAQIAYNEALEKANKIEDPKKRQVALQGLKDQEKALRKLEKQTDKNVRQSIDFFEKQQRLVQEWMSEGVRLNIQTMYEGTPQQMFVDSVLGRTQNLEDRSVGFTIEVGISSAQLNPSVVEEIFKIVGNDETAAGKIALAIETAGADDANRLFSAIAMLDDEELKKELSIQVPDRDAQQIDSIANALEYVQTLPDDVKKSITAQTFGINEALELNRILNNFDEIPNTASKKRYAEFFENNFSEVYFNMQWFKDLPPEIRKRFVAEYAIYFNEFGTLTPAGRNAYNKAFGGQAPLGLNAEQEAARLAREQQRQAEEEAAALSAATVTNVTSGKDKRDKTGGGSESWLQGLIKEIDATLQILPKEMNRLKNRVPNIPQEFVNLIGFGEEGLARITELLGLKGRDLKNLVNKWIKKTTSEINQGIENEIAAGRNKQKAFNILVERGFSIEDAEQIASNSEYAFTIVQAKAGKADKTLKQVIKSFRDLESVSSANPNQKIIDGINDRIDLEKKAFDKAMDQVDDLIDAQQDRVQSIQEEIDALEELNSADQRLLRDKDRQIEMYNRQIDGVERLIEKEQESIDKLKEEDELRNRRSSVLSRDLEKLSESEEDIRNAYQQRIDALEKVATINDRILQQQKDQLNVSQALASGDIYEATRAAREMQQNDVAFAQTQAREALTAGMENEIAALRTAGGLTREEAEKEIANIKEQSYQTSLLIQGIEDAILTKNKEIEGIKRIIRDVEDEKLKIEDRIYDRETLILDIQNKRLEPAQKQYEKLVNQRDEMKKIFDTKIATMEKEVEELELGKKRVDQINSLGDAWIRAGEAIAAANKALKEGETKLGRAPVRIPTESYDDWQGKLTKWFADKAALEATYNAAVGAAYSSGNAAMSSVGGTSTNPYAIGGMGIQFRNMGGMIKKYMRGGSVGMDSVPAMLTPGEFVIRKAMVDKYGTPMFDSINQGSFSMPRYDTQTSTEGNVKITSQNTSNIVAPMYNNYSVNVSVSNPNASADEIANKAIMKIQQMQNMQIRGGRGY